MHPSGNTHKYDRLQTSQVTCIACETRSAAYATLTYLSGPPAVSMSCLLTGTQKQTHHSLPGDPTKAVHCQSS